MTLANIYASRSAREASKFFTGDDSLSQAATAIMRGVRGDYATADDACYAVALAEKALRLHGYAVAEFRVEAQRAAGIAHGQVLASYFMSVTGLER